MTINELLKLTLETYEKECQYLKEVTINDHGTWGKFSVPTTVYAIKGRKYHLNAAEVIILYEQICYVTLANLFINGLNKLTPIPVDIFFPTVVDKNIVIAKFNTRFSKQVNNHEFSALFKINNTVSRGQGYWFDTVLDINSGAQIAEVKIYVDMDLPVNYIEPWKVKDHSLETEMVNTL